MERKEWEKGKKSSKRHKRKLSSSSSSSSDSSSSVSLSSLDEETKKKLMKKFKKLKKKEKRKKKEKKALKKKSKISKISKAESPEKKVNVASSSGVPSEDLVEKSKSLAPMTKEEWEKQQNTLRRVYDEETGRMRLIRGTGEIVEECVSRERHLAINKQATKGDGEYFQKLLFEQMK